jgi:hypothetical protein
MATHRIYRALIRLYPKEFRRNYGDDLLQAHADLVHEHGRSRAWWRTGLDVAITVPRYRLETIMTTRHPDTSLHVVIAALLILGVLATMDGGAVLGIPVLLIAVILTIAQRSRLARSLRSPDGDQRRRRLRIAGVLGGVCVVTLAVFVIDIGNDDSWGTRAFVYINIFNIAFVAAIVYLVAGLATRRPPSGTITAQPVNR